MIDETEEAYRAYMNEYSAFRTQYPKKEDRSAYWFKLLHSELPAKCQECYKHIRFCRFWNNGFECEASEIETQLMELF